MVQPQSGADAVLISSPWKISLIKDVNRDLPLESLVSEYMADMDLVLTEGYRRAAMPQVEVFRSAAHATPLHTFQDPGSLIALMSDIPVDLRVPNFDINDIPSLADLIQRTLLDPLLKSSLR